MRTDIRIAAFTLVAVLPLCPIFAGALSTTPKHPTITDVHGNVLKGIWAGHQIILSYEFQNNGMEFQPFVFLFEIRNEDGTTKYLAWQKGVAEPGGSNVAGISWMTEEGDYEVRVFVVSDMENPRVLSEVSASKMEVHG